MCSALFHSSPLPLKALRRQTARHDVYGRHRDRREGDDARRNDRGGGAPAAGKRRAEMERRSSCVRQRLRDQFRCFVTVNAFAAGPLVLSFERSGRRLILEAIPGGAEQIARSSSRIGLRRPAARNLPPEVELAGPLSKTSPCEAIARMRLPARRTACSKQAFLIGLP
jgi:hypothetical protein